MKSIFNSRRPTRPHLEKLEIRCLLAAPSIVTLPADNIELRAATIGAELLETGGPNPNVSLYWGTSDGGEDTRSWENSRSLGSVDVGIHTTRVENLSVNTPYFYRAFAFNFAGGTAWTDVATFSTLPPEPATLESDPIAFVSGTTADLSGRVTETGGDIPDVVVFYGTENGNEDEAAWQSQVNLGPTEGEFSTQLNNLRPNTKYFVRLGAKNGSGVGWDPQTYEVQTADIPQLRISEWMAANSSTAETRTRVNPEVRFQNGDQAFDWLEIQNAASDEMDISGFHLTDNDQRPTKWTIPDGTTIPAGGTLLFYASGFDLTDPNFDEEGRFHTNFKLSSGGEYIAITDREGKVVHEVADYPQQLHDASYGYFRNELGFFREPTPGELNRPFGPRIGDVQHVYENDDPSQSWTVTAQVAPSLASVTDVSLNYRVMFDEVTSLAMTDDGSGADQTAGDGIFTGVIPGGIAQPGQMVRYNVTATDELDLQTPNPLFPNPDGSPEYYGTMIADPALESNFPVLHRFIEEPRRANSGRGTRTSIFYDGEFYDNAFIRIRGGTARNWPKRAYKIEFNDDHHFRFRDDVPRVDEFNLNTTYTDKSYMRAVLTAELHNDSGSPAPETFLMRVQENNEFFSIAIFVEQPDNDFLRRHGHDTEGAFYKGGPGSAYRTTAGFEKKNREYEDRSDLTEFINGLKLQDDDLENFMFDNINLPAQINFMAGVTVTQNIDASDKNHYLYRDTNGTGEWHMTPWDLDLSFGPDALNTDRILADENTRGASNPNAVQPFIGGHRFPLHTGKTNELLDRIIEHPRTQEMLKRRIRTLTDEFLATGYFENRIDELLAQLGDEVALDREKWGNAAHFNRNLRPISEEADRIKNEYLARRLPYLTEFHVNGGIGLPTSQPEEARIEFGTIEANPSSGNHAEEYITLQNPNEFAVDLSNWNLTGAINHQIAAGTVIPAGENLYLATNVAGFRARAEGPTGGQGHFVQGTDAELPNEGGLLNLQDARGVTISTTTFGTIDVNGDFNSDGQIDQHDIDELCSALLNGQIELRFDLNSDLKVDRADHAWMVQNTIGTVFGDTNLDGQFGLNDLTLAFASEEYEDGIARNSLWHEGDWNCDGDFTSADLVAALKSVEVVAEANPAPSINQIASAVDGAIPNRAHDKFFMEQTDDKAHKSEQRWQRRPIMVPATIVDSLFAS